VAVGDLPVRVAAAGGVEQEPGRPAGPLPGLHTGLLETNRQQNYARWDTLMAEHPCAGAPWTAPRHGLFELDYYYYYYRRRRGIFEPVPGADRWFPENDGRKGPFPPP